MLSQYFGSFLLNKGYISRDTLEHALSQEKSTKLKLGILAVSEGVLTADQVEQIHNQQKTQDKRFGELAVELNYLTDEQVGMLLNLQKSSKVELSQILIDEGLMDLRTLEKALQAYKEDANLSEVQMKAIKSGSIDEIVEAFVNIPTQENKGLYQEYIQLFIRNMIRFIDSAPVIKVENQEINPQHVAVKQGLSGAINMSSYMVFPESTYVAFASRYSGMDITEKNELADASVTEFLNLHNGIFVVNLSDQGIKMDLSPPVTLSGAEVSERPALTCITIELEIGTCQLVIQ
ncbi:chemotaxis protein CheX [Desulfuribacillus alkaliarsenatis]|uniref:Chemotaxis phosphatase CheX-like domain-containing protein n=1 Tax=Desulfuribacillus alkaliarsenatis TaxID=766136 RepID=A0A1E5G5F4_9FIRM|nr:chemotaxis protein CheX [Desulfuribacillus alkaliarsenatis]OEF98339.1 hypothetical protein BHF68_01270 [Desulfuribacillus alkaliarsenatis]